MHLALTMDLPSSVDHPVAAAVLNYRNHIRHVQQLVVLLVDGKFAVGQEVVGQVGAEEAHTHEEHTAVVAAVVRTEKTESGLEEVMSVGWVLRIGSGRTGFG